MTRRGFLRALVLGVPAAPAVAERLAAAPAFWQPIQWAKQAFDYGNVMGYAMGVRHWLTGEVRRRGVRLPSLHRRGMARAQQLAEVEARAREHLEAWRAGLNA